MVNESSFDLHSAPFYAVYQRVNLTSGAGAKLLVRARASCPATNTSSSTSSLPNFDNNIIRGNLILSIAVLVLLQARQDFDFADKPTPWTPLALQIRQTIRTLVLHGNGVEPAMVSLPVEVESSLWRLVIRAPARRMRVEYVDFYVFDRINHGKGLAYIYSAQQQPLLVSLQATQQPIPLQAVVQDRSEAQSVSFLLHSTHLSPQHPFVALVNEIR